MNYFFRLLERVKELHSLYYLHKDLKPANCVCYFDQENRKTIIKLIDFGFVQDTNWITRTENVGTASSMVLDVRFIKEECGYEIDIWSMGFIFYEMLVGQPLLNKIQLG